MAHNVLRLGEGCLTDAKFSHEFQWQLLPKRYYKQWRLSSKNSKTKNMYKEPKEQAKEMFNKIRYMDGENKNCTTCDCVIKPILNYMIDEILRSNPSDWFNNGFEWEKEFFSTPVNEGWVSAENYWNAVKSVVAGW